MGLWDRVKKDIQKGVDENWARLENICNSTCKVA